MQIIENWSDVTGTVLSVRAAEAPRGFVAIELQVESVGPIEGFANLLGESIGNRLVVHVPENLAAKAGASPGRRLRCRVRRADLHRAFVHPEHFSAVTGEG